MLSSSLTRRKRQLFEIYNRINDGLPMRESFVMIPNDSISRRAAHDKECALVRYPLLS